MKILLLFIFLVILMFNANSMGVVSDFLTNNTLEIIEGTSKTYRIGLQNPTNSIAGFTITYDKSNANIIDFKEIYDVQPQSEYPIYFNISAENKEPGENFIISYTVHQVSGGGEGIPLLLKINKNFRVKIIDDPQRFIFDYRYALYPSIAIVAVGYLMYKKRERAALFRGKRKHHNKKES